MTPRAAARLLGLVNGFGAEDVRAAFVAKVKATHPDMNPGEDLGADVAALVAAKDLLLGNQANEIPCPQCRGSGSIKGKIGVYECGRCGGEGVV